jgi:hypothetical protein
MASYLIMPYHVVVRSLLLCEVLPTWYGRRAAATRTMKAACPPAGRWSPATPYPTARVVSDPLRNEVEVPSDALASEPVPGAGGTLM